MNTRSYAAVLAACKPFEVADDTARAVNPLDTASLATHDSTPLPDDFEPAAPNRAALWASTPAEIQAFVLGKCVAVETLSRHNGALLARCDELQALADEAWAARFQSSAVYKVKVLQRAHRIALERLRASWAAPRLASGERQSIATIHDLDRQLLDKILDLVLTDDVPARPLDSLLAVYEPKTDPLFHRRRALAQVCRFLEAVTYSSRAASLHVIAQPGAALPPSGPPGFAARDLERAALALRLTEIEIYVSTPFSDSSPETAAAAAVLPHCAALSRVHICLQANGASLAAIPPEIVAALPLCSKLTHLRLEAYGQSRKSDLVKMDMAAAGAFVDALTALTQLTSLEVVGIDLTACDRLFPALEQHPTLRDLRLASVSATPGWHRLLFAPRLTTLAVANSPRWSMLPLGPPSTSGDRLQTLFVASNSLDDQSLMALAQALLRFTSVHTLDLEISNIGHAGAASVEALAAALSGMTALKNLTVYLPGKRSLEVDGALFRALPLCARLEHVDVTVPPDVDAAWIVALAGALGACQGLRSVGVIAKERVGDLLAPLFDALPAIAALTDLYLRGALSLRSLCTLGVALPRCSSLEWLWLEECEMSDQDRAVFESLAAHAPHVRLGIS